MLSLFISLFIIATINVSSTATANVDLSVEGAPHGVGSVNGATSLLHRPAFNTTPFRPDASKAEVAPNAEAGVPVWVVPLAIEFGINLLSSRGTSRGLGRILRAIPYADLVAELLRYRRMDGVNATERRALDEVLSFVNRLEESAQRNGNDIGRIRSDLQRRFNYTAEQLAGLDRRLRGLEDRITTAELKIIELVRQGEATQAELRAIKRTMANQDFRIAELEGQVVDHEGRLVSLEDRMTVLEGIVNRDDYYNKHVFGFAGQVLYANAATSGYDGTPGVAGEVSYLFNRHFGVFAHVLFAPVEARTTSPLPFSADTTREAVLMWDNYAAYVGAFADLVPGNSPVTFRLGVAGGITINQFVENPSNATFLQRTESVVHERRTNPSLLAKADLGFSPPRFPLEPYLSVGVSALLDPIETDHMALVAPEFGAALWYISLGARWRFSTAEQVGLDSR